jgi:hypothetical protein
LLKPRFCDLAGGSAENAIRRTRHLFASWWNAHQLPGVGRVTGHVDRSFITCGDDDLKRAAEFREGGREDGFELVEGFDTLYRGKTQDVTDEVGSYQVVCCGEVSFANNFLAPATDKGLAWVYGSGSQSMMAR